MYPPVRNSTRDTEPRTTRDAVQKEKNSGMEYTLCFSGLKERLMYMCLLYGLIECAPHTPSSARTLGVPVLVWYGSL